MLTGVSTAPTAAAGTNTTQIASTAFVQTAVNGVKNRVGDIGMTHATTPPPNAIFWTNSPLSRTSYAALFALYGATYGGDGSTTFCLPPLADGDVLWAAVTASLSRTTSVGDNLSHGHTATAGAVGDHVHPLQVAHAGTTYSSNDAKGNSLSNADYSYNTRPSGAHTHTITVASVGGSKNKAAGLGARFYVYYQ